MSASSRSSAPLAAIPRIRGLTVPTLHRTVHDVDFTAYSNKETMMHAIVQDTYGSVDVLHSQDIDVPEIADDEVLVRVAAASIHVGDWILMTGSPFVMRFATGLRKPKNRVPGTDVAGTAEAGGSAVTT